MGSALPKMHLWDVAPGGDEFMDGYTACGKINNAPCHVDPELTTCGLCKRTWKYADAIKRRRTCLATWPDFT